MIARHGQLVHAVCFGLRDIEAQKPMQIDTLFPIFSMTKPILAVAMMILYEEGRYQLFDPLSRFISEFKDVKVIKKTSEEGIELTDPDRDITIHDLLIQTAGILSDGWLSPQLSKLINKVDLYQPDITLQEFNKRLVKLPLIHQPGKAWRYGEWPEVLGHLVELISGMSFDTFLEKRIFEPLGMTDTRFGIFEDQRDRLAKLYGYSDAGGFVETVEFTPRLIPSPIPRGGFGLISTAPDYLRFVQILLNKGELGDVRILGRKTVEYITRNHLSKELVPIELAPGYSINGYGYGILFGVMVDAVQAGFLGSEGEYYWGGLSTIFGIDPKEQLIFLLMTRLEYPGHIPIYYTFRTLVYQTIIE